MPQNAVVRPFQNEDQVPVSVSEACQVLRYGERTASGVAGGRSGLKVVAAAVVAAVAASAVPVNRPTAPATSAATLVQRSRSRREAVPAGGFGVPETFPEPGVLKGCEWDMADPLGG